MGAASLFVPRVYLLVAPYREGFTIAPRREWCRGGRSCIASVPVAFRHVNRQGQYRGKGLGPWPVALPPLVGIALCQPRRAVLGLRPYRFRYCSGPKLWTLFRHTQIKTSSRSKIFHTSQHWRGLQGQNFFCATRFGGAFRDGVEGRRG